MIGWELWVCGFISYCWTRCVGAISWGWQRSQGPSTTISPEEKRKESGKGRTCVRMKWFSLPLSTARTPISVSILVSSNNTISGYTKAISPPSLPFNLANCTYVLFILLFPQAFSSHPWVWHFLWVSDEGYTFGQNPGTSPHSARPAVKALSHGHLVGAA